MSSSAEQLSQMVGDLGLTLCDDPEPWFWGNLAVDGTRYEEFRQAAEESGALKGHWDEMGALQDWDQTGDKQGADFSLEYAHGLNLTTEEQMVLAGVYREVTAQPRVRWAHGLLEWKLPDVGEHQKRVALDAAALAIKDGRVREEILLVADGSINHDNGKGHPTVMQAINSPFTFAQKPRLRQDIQFHPAAGAEMLASLEPMAESYEDIYRLRNAVILTAGHHFAQPAGRGEAYGALALEEGFPDEQGRRPDIRLLAEYLQACDVYDAIRDPQRIYRQAESNNHETALDVVDTMPISDRTKELIHATFTGRLVYPASGAKRLAV